MPDNVNERHYEDVRESRATVRNTEQHQSPRNEPTGELPDVQSGDAWSHFLQENSAPFAV